MSENGRVSTREFLEDKIDALRDHIDQRFDALEQQRRGDVGRIDDHEDRLRKVEGRLTLSNVVTGVSTAVLAVASYLGIQTK